MLSYGNDQDLLDQVKEYAELYFTPKEIAILLKIDFEEFAQQLRNENSEVYKAYHLGKLQNLETMRRLTLQQALDGSPGAITELLELKNDQELSEIDL